MTPDQQRIAIARACGWTCCGQVPGLHPHGLIPWRKIDDYTNQQVLNHEVPLETLPNYLENLNAIHDAEIKLTWRQRDMVADYLQDGRGGCFATAAQRAEAFLHTIGKWVEP